MVVTPRTGLIVEESAVILRLGTTRPRDFSPSAAPFENPARPGVLRRGKDSGREIREYFIPDFSN
jgi:hypothetical protein